MIFSMSKNDIYGEKNEIEGIQISRKNEFMEDRVRKWEDQT